MTSVLADSTLAASTLALSGSRLVRTPGRSTPPTSAVVVAQPDAVARPDAVAAASVPSAVPRSRRWARARAQVTSLAVAIAGNIVIVLMIAVALIAPIVAAVLTFGRAVLERL